MATGQPLRGLVGQSMTARKKKPNFSAAGTGPAYLYAPGTYTFTVPTSGKWMFLAWGAGGGSTGLNPASGSGGYAETSRYLVRGRTVAMTVGIASAGSGAATTLTFPDGTVVTCGGGASGGAGGSASGGDVNLAGSVGGAPGLGTGGGAASSGAGAPGNLPFRGGDGGVANSGGQAPGGGAGTCGSSIAVDGGNGLVLAVFLRS